MRDNASKLLVNNGSGTIEKGAPQQLRILRVQSLVSLVPFIRLILSSSRLISVCIQLQLSQLMFRPSSHRSSSYLHVPVC